MAKKTPSKTLKKAPAKTEKKAAKAKQPAPKVQAKPKTPVKAAKKADKTSLKPVKKPVAKPSKPETKKIVAKPAPKAAAKPASAKPVSKAAKVKVTGKLPAKKTGVEKKAETKKAVAAPPKKSAPVKAEKKATKPAPAPKTEKKKDTVPVTVVKLDNAVQFSVNPKVYPLDLVYQAAFIFIDRTYAYLDMDAKGQIVVQLKGKAALDAPALDALAGEFRNELLNQAVRKQLAKENKRLRELIVAKALFSAARPQELREVMDSLESRRPVSEEPAPRPWDDATKEEQDELDRLLAEIEKDFAEDPMGIAVPWDEKYGDKAATPEAPLETPSKQEAMPVYNPEPVDQGLPEKVLVPAYEKPESSEPDDKTEKE